MASTEDQLAEAWNLFRSGDRQRAAGLAQACLNARPENSEALRLLAAIALAEGQLPAAADLFGRLSRMRPDDLDVRNSLGVALARLGKLDDALRHFLAIRSARPDSPEAHNNVGLVLKDQRQLTEAEQLFRQALRLRPDFAAAHNNLGLALRDQRRLKEASESFMRSIQLDPRTPEAHYNLGQVLSPLGQPDAAEACLRKAVWLRPAYSAAHAALGTLLAERRPDNPEVGLRQAVASRPGEPAAFWALASYIQDLGKPEEAEPLFRHALRLRPDAPAHDNVGASLARQGKYAEARTYFLKAVELAPHAIGSLINVGNTFASEGELDEAERFLRKALQVDPEQAEAHYSLAMILLLRGDFERGWPEYEWRWRSRGVRRVRLELPQPEWDGSDLSGRTILLHAEGGLGDTIQFIRYAPLIKARGATVVLDVQVALASWLTGQPGIDRINARGEPLPAHDVHAPLMSLPRIMGTRLDTIPAKDSYLSVEPELAERWRRELSGLSGLKVGIAWQGSPRHYQDRIRSFPLASFEVLAKLDGVSLVSLQKHFGREQIPAFASRFPLLDLGARLDEPDNTYLDTPAVLRSLDLVITPDTSLAHAAGALGVPVWLALPSVPEFRWMLDRDDSPWYPTMRLFRQKRPGDWGEVFGRMAAELTLLKERKGNANRH